MMLEANKYKKGAKGFLCGVAIILFGLWYGWFMYLLWFALGLDK